MLVHRDAQVRAMCDGCFKVGKVVEDPEAEAMLVDGRPRRHVCSRDCAERVGLPLIEANRGQLRRNGGSPDAPSS